MGCIAKQFLNFCPRPLLVHDFCSRVLVPSNSFHKNQKKVCASDSHGRHEVQSLTKIQIFMVSGHDFYTTASIRRSKFAFSCIIQPILSEKWKKKCFNTVLDTYIRFQSSNFTFHPKKGQNSGPNIFGTSWDFGEKIYQVPNVIIQYKISKNKENLKKSLPSLTLFCLDFSENGS